MPQKRGMSGFEIVSSQLRREYEIKLREARADYERNLQFACDFLTQACLDAFLMTANDLWDLGPSRVKEASEAFSEYFHRMMDALIDDAYDEKTGNGSKDLAYFWASVDERMEQIEGTYFTPHEERYDETGTRLFTELFRRFVARTLANGKATGDEGTGETVDGERGRGAEDGHGGD